MFNDNSALIKDNLEVYSLLKNIQKSKQLISLSFESLPQYCLTSLIDVHHDTELLIFDEPNPRLNDKLTQTKNEITLSLKLDNVPVLFKSKLIPNSSRNIDSIQSAHFPKIIHYAQNRKYYRFNTENINEITTTVFFSSIKRLHGQLVNISLNGLCLRLPYSFAAMFPVNQHVDDIYIELPNQSGFSISAKVKNSRIEKNYNYIALGLQIQKPKISIEKTIQQFIFRSSNLI